MRLLDGEGKLLSEDGKTQGNLQIRGHWTIESYFRADGSALPGDGWFDTGDVASIDADVLAFHDGKIASWQVPDKVIFVDELPLNRVRPANPTFSELLNPVMLPGPCNAMA